MLRYQSALDQVVHPNQNFEESLKLNKHKLNSVLVNINTPKRVIKKYGGINTFLKHKVVPQNFREYLKDFGHTLLVTKWRWIWLTVILVNLATYFLFSFFWMWLAYISGDFDPDNTTPCVVNTKTLTGYFLLSMETITSIGYGYRYPTENCRKGWILLTFQALCSVALQGVLVSAIYVKISRPFRKVLNSLFSKKAVVSIVQKKILWAFFK
ncbi:unnamed protein product [Brassicogethes aeneus]|uniref:Potassium channel inwardly rectifying transmembrane domain-containing protein n=1 Tax=Brassicogethes aeneus TaxID=1431903 RepID=A0A9P0FF41_BRAAE|nr:unnamed protein product [Brassicogethes aeneus]